MLSPTAFGEQCKQRQSARTSFPILGEVSWCFEIFAVITLELQGMTATCFTNVIRKLNFPKPFQNLNQNLPNWPDTAQNILHNLHGQHEATYAQDCTFHLSLPLLILVLVLVPVRLLLLLVHQGNRPGTLSPCPQPDRFQYVLEPPRLEPCLDPGTHPEPPWNIAPEPWSLARNLKPCPEPPRNTAPEPAPTFPEPCPGTLPRNLPRNLPGTRGSEAAPAPPRNLYWLRPHS